MKCEENDKRIATCFLSLKIDISFCDIHKNIVRKCITQKTVHSFFLVAKRLPWFSVNKRDLERNQEICISL